MMRLLLVLAIAAGFSVYHFRDVGVNNELTNSSTNQSRQENVNNGSEIIRQAFENHISNLQVEATGKVVKVLADDTNPPRHQRFILKLNNGITLLVAHNIDLAKRVAELKVGDEVSFYGEYEWNNKGGVLHWTHIDPQHRHADGWLKYNGQTYQ